MPPKLAAEDTSVPKGRLPSSFAGLQAQKKGSYRLDSQRSEVTAGREGVKIAGGSIFGDCDASVSDAAVDLARIHVGPAWLRSARRACCATRCRPRQRRPNSVLPRAHLGRDVVLLLDELNLLDRLSCDKNKVSEDLAESRCSRGFFGRDGCCFLFPRYGDRLSVGSTRLGHLVDLGRPANCDPCSLAYICVLPGAAQCRGGRWDADARCGSGDFRLLRCSDCVHGYKMVAHAAPRPSLLWWSWV
jgi:hypothetical protein